MCPRRWPVSGRDGFETHSDSVLKFVRKRKGKREGEREGGREGGREGEGGRGRERGREGRRERAKAPQAWFNTEQVQVSRRASAKE
jgi:hypothetical protein